MKSHYQWGTSIKFPNNWAISSLGEKPVQGLNFLQRIVYRSPEQVQPPCWGLDLSVLPQALEAGEKR